MKLDDFDFELPEQLISTRPISPRGAGRLLISKGTHISDDYVKNLVDYFQANDRLILNDTKVIAARLSGKRTRNSAQGAAKAKITVTLLEQKEADTWRALLKPLRKVAVAESIDFGDGLEAKCIDKTPQEALLQFSKTGADLTQAIEQQGLMPLPPYIASKRAPDAQDRHDYQTIWARKMGAVAAPTASLHFEEVLIDKLRAKGVEISYVTLHVGAGTFLPVKVQNIAHHKMHAEWGEITDQAAQQINATKAAGGRVIAVGTTALRLIESAAQNGLVHPWRGKTDIFIYPGFEFQITDALMTNFHLPKSTLLMLVAALIGKPQLDAVYAHAVRQKYRFFSYGDASLLFP